MKLQFYAQVQEKCTDVAKEKYLAVIATTRYKPTGPAGDMVIKFTIDVPESALVPEVTGAIVPLTMDTVVKELKQAARDLAP